MCMSSCVVGYSIRGMLVQIRLMTRRVAVLTFVLGLVDLRIVVILLKCVRWRLRHVASVVVVLGRIGLRFGYIRAVLVARIRLDNLCSEVRQLLSWLLGRVIIAALWFRTALLASSVVCRGRRTSIELDARLGALMTRILRLVQISILLLARFLLFS